MLPAPPKHVPAGRIADMLLARPDADRIAIRPTRAPFGSPLWGDFNAWRFADRAGMLAALRGNAGEQGWKALVKDTVASENLVAYPAYQCAAR